MIKEKDVPVITSTNLRTGLQNLDDHTILTILLEPPEGAPTDAES